MKKIVNVVGKGALRKGLDYLLPVCTASDAVIGARVIVPLGNRFQAGVVVACSTESLIPHGKLKPVKALCEQGVCLPASHMAFLSWMAKYYHVALADVVVTALPRLWLESDPILSVRKVWQAVPKQQARAEVELKRAPKQWSCFEFLRTLGRTATAQELAAQGFSSAILRQLHEKRFVDAVEVSVGHVSAIDKAKAVSPVNLNLSQQEAVKHVALDCFGVYLLYGVTGSGKTEVYLELAEQVLAQEKQVLLLVPEIGLTAQLLARVRARLGGEVGFFHSGMTDKERSEQAYFVAAGAIKILVGTRSAVFLPFAHLGLVVVDEEHDLSYKDQAGIRYHGRDVAIKRAQLEGVPIVLGSATPSVETYANVAKGGYHLLTLGQMYHQGAERDIEWVDLRRQPVKTGLSHYLVAQIKSCLEQGRQVLLFLNRRGFSPVLLCHACGWGGKCCHCDTYMTVHRAPESLQCHHCGASMPLPRACPECHSPELIFSGVGTEKLEVYLQDCFPGKTVVRIDRTSMNQKEKLSSQLACIQSGDADIVIGTQMVAKGHHFKHLGLVGVVDGDAGLYSIDFRAKERMAQLLVQVCGRVGREQKGRVLIQTHQPEHPLLSELFEKDYLEVVKSFFEERKLSGLPPVTFMALIRAQAKQQNEAEAFLEQLKQQLRHPFPQVEMLGPAPSVLAKRGGYFRMHLLLCAEERNQLHAALNYIEQSPMGGKGIKLYWDVDPQEVV